MKKYYIENIQESFEAGDTINLPCWVKNKRQHSNVVFFDLVDSTGLIKGILDRTFNQESNQNDADIVVESSVMVTGVLCYDPIRKEKSIGIKEIKSINTAKLNLTPQPRSDFDILDNKYLNHVLNNRHVYIRNPKVILIIKLKSHLLKSFRMFFDEMSFWEVDMPIMSQGYLYSESSSFKVDYFGTEAYLSQCCGLYLGATVNSLEKVFTVAPAFRKEPSKSPRHNPEFWHIKAQAAFYDLDDMMLFTSEMIHKVVSSFVELGEKELKMMNIKVDLEKLTPPYPIITYDEAVEIITKMDKKFSWGKSLSQAEEKLISLQFSKPVFIKGMPAQVEPFPYKRDRENGLITRTADLLCTDGFGELLGVAEFITDEQELKERILEKGNASIENIDWYKQLPSSGIAPFSGFGMGIERALRWLLKLPHVREAFLFPRLYHRPLYP